MNKNIGILLGVLLFCSSQGFTHDLSELYNIPVKHVFSENARRCIGGRAESCEIIMEMLEQETDPVVKKVLKVNLLCELKKVEKVLEREIYHMKTDNFRCLECKNIAEVSEILSEIKKFEVLAR